MMSAAAAEKPFLSRARDILDAAPDSFEADQELYDMASDQETWEMEAETTTATMAPGSHTDDPVELYFRDIRQHDLLDVAAERALWRRIERHKARMRRALYGSPVALRTFTRLWNQIKHGEIPLQDVIRLSTNEESVSTGVLERLSDTIAKLHELAADLRRHRSRAATASISVVERRQRRREWARVRRQWLSAWEMLTLHPNVDESLRIDLERESLSQPDNVRLRRAHRAWMSAKRQFDEATADMLRANLRLVVHVAMRFRDSRAPLLDLIQEGNLGLMRAVEKFEPERGLKFITYAHWWVRQAIGRALINQGRTVRLPGHIVERHNKVRAATDQLWRLSGRAPTAQEIGDALGWTPQEVEQLQMAAQETMPLEKRLPDSGGTIADLIEDPSARNPNAAAEGEELKHCLEVWFDSLKPREAMILRRRYGFETGQPQTLQDVGDALGMSRERVRQIEKATLERLRESPLIAELEMFMRN